jgi:2-polyprenyl-3-methyl-5-hydroxy-6-metoxy-1,4-benzoquinol methylase
MIKSALSGEPLESPIYLSDSDFSVTSLSKIYSGVTKVYYDPKIGHLQTNEIEGINKYYDEEYKIFDESEEDDILYEVVNGIKIFRQQHQVDTFLSKVELTPGIRILDYGCAKGTVLKRLHQHRPDILPYLFDVSKMYVHLWEKFVPPGQYAFYTVKKEWSHLFDVVTSFFAFEHTPDPLNELATIKELLKPSGLIYMIVPNVYKNIGDFIVADHVHHYSEVSLNYMFGKAGFEIMDIDITSHFAAYIVIAKNSGIKTHFLADPADLAEIKENAHRTAEYWKALRAKINGFEQEIGDKRGAIYGAGVYGNFIASCLDNPERLVCIVDQNPLLHGKTIIGKPILLPKELPSDIEVVYVGLNPLTSKSSMESVDWEGRKLVFFYL